MCRSMKILAFSPSEILASVLISFGYILLFAFVHVFYKNVQTCLWILIRSCHFGIPIYIIRVEGGGFLPVGDAYVGSSKVFLNPRRQIGFVSTFKVLSVWAGLMKLMLELIKYFLWLRRVGTVFTTFFSYGQWFSFTHFPDLLGSDLCST